MKNVNVSAVHAVWQMEALGAPVLARHVQTLRCHRKFPNATRSPRGQNINIRTVINI